MENLEHYIGVTGFMSRHEVEQALAVPPGSYAGKLMVGVLATYKTLNNLPQHRAPRRHPYLGEFHEIFSNNSRALNIVHYYSHVPSELLEQLMLLVVNSGNRLHGIQLNIPWPDPGELSLFRHGHPDKKIILQIGEECIASATNQPDRLARLIVNYRDIIDAVLFDRSAGKGQYMKLDFIGRCVAELRSRDHKIGIGVAGGLSAQNLDEVRKLKIFGWPVNIDAEGRLRTKDDNLDVKEVEAYLRKAYDIFGA